MGAALFTLGLLAVLVGAPYLIQFALWLFALTLLGAICALDAMLAAVGALGRAMWWMRRPEAAIITLGQAETR